MLARDVMRLLFVLCILPFGGEVCRFRKPNGTRRCIQELAIGGLELIFYSKPGQIKGSSNEDQTGNTALLLQFCNEQQGGNDIFLLR